MPNFFQKKNLKAPLTRLAKRWASISFYFSKLWQSKQHSWYFHHLVITSFSSSFSTFTFSSFSSTFSCSLFSPDRFCQSPTYWYWVECFSCHSYLLQKVQIHPISYIRSPAADLKCWCWSPQEKSWTPRGNFPLPCERVKCKVIEIDNKEFSLHKGAQPNNLRAVSP